MKAVKINHVTLLVKDKVVSEKFFTEILGLEKYDAGGRLWIKIGDQFIHITSASGDPGRNNFYHFAILVEDAASCAKEIAAKGIRVFDLDDDQNEILVNSEFDKPRRQYFFKDPDDNLLELIDEDNNFFNPRSSV
jgi:catechol 2,3-dioxygenase-like lactoylglutathione lyase family enzyme